MQGVIKKRGFKVLHCLACNSENDNDMISRVLPYLHPHTLHHLVRIRRRQWTDSRSDSSLDSAVDPADPDPTQTNPMHRRSSEWEPGSRQPHKSLTRSWTGLSRRVPFPHSRISIRTLLISWFWFYFMEDICLEGHWVLLSSVILHDVSASAPFHHRTTIYIVHCLPACIKDRTFHTLGLVTVTVTWRFEISWGLGLKEGWIAGPNLISQTILGDSRKESSNPDPDPRPHSPYGWIIMCVTDREISVQVWSSPRIWL
jgi:hypothetical protein